MEKNKGPKTEATALPPEEVREREEQQRVERGSHAVGQRRPWDTLQARRRTFSQTHRHRQQSEGYQQLRGWGEEEEGKEGQIYGDRG